MSIDRCGVDVIHGHTTDNFRCVRCNTQQMTDNQLAAAADVVDGVGASDDDDDDDG